MTFQASLSYVVLSVVALAAAACSAEIEPVSSGSQEIHGDGVQCAAYPSCDAGDEEVASESACLQDDARCYQSSLCGSTIWCTGPAVHQCEAYPACEPGDQEVASESGCLQDDASCYQRSICGYTIWCTGPVAQCAAYPSCDAGDQEVSSPSGCLQDDARCYERSLCGATIWCTGPSN
jgi:hypothetical protein